MAKNLPQRDVFNLTIKEAKWICLLLGLAVLLGIFLLNHFSKRMDELEVRRTELHEQVAGSHDPQLVAELEEVVAEHASLTRWRKGAIAELATTGFVFLGLCVETVKFMMNPKKKKGRGRK